MQSDIDTLRSSFILAFKMEFLTLHNLHAQWILTFITTTSHYVDGAREERIVPTMNHFTVYFSRPFGYVSIDSYSVMVFIDGICIIWYM